MKDVQREGWEYELTVSLNIDRDTHTAIASKDRTELFEGLAPFIITEDTGKMIKEWCEKGVDTTARDNEIKSAITHLETLNTVDDLKAYRDSLPSYVFDSNEFKLAGGKRYTTITTEGFLATHDNELNATLIEN